jgi:hypothetical protein
MHRFNVIAMAAIVSLSVVVAYSVRAANSAELVPQMAPMQDTMWIEQMSLPIKELTIQRRRDGLVEEAAKLTGRKGAVGVLRAPKAPLKPTRTIAARDVSAFEREVRRRFHMGEESIIAYAAPMALQPEGRRATGFVARVEAGGKSCDFAIAGYTETADSDAIVAMARLILCDPVSTLTPPEIRVSALLNGAEKVQ